MDKDFFAKLVAVGLFVGAIAIAGGVDVNPARGPNATIDLNKVCFNGSASNCLTEGANILTWGGNNGVAASLFRTTSSTMMSSTFAGVNALYASDAAGKWQMLSNISAVNAGATGQTSATMMQPVNALDAADYVFSVNNSSGTSLFNVAHGGAVSLAGGFTVVGGNSSITGGSIALSGSNIELQTDGDIIVTGREQHAAQAVTTGGAYTLDPTSSYVQLNPASAATVTMGETGALSGSRVCITNIHGSNTAAFADTSGVSELTGAFTMGQYDTLCLLYASDRWVEISRSNN